MRLIQGLVPEFAQQIFGHSFGGGIGYHIGQSLRLGFNADMIRRVSADPAREYERPTYGASVTYEF